MSNVAILCGRGGAGCLAVVGRREFLYRFFAVVGLFIFYFFISWIFILFCFPFFLPKLIFYLLFPPYKLDFWVRLFLSGGGGVRLKDWYGWLIVISLVVRGFEYRFLRLFR